MDFLRDPIWQFVGAVLALVAVLVTVYLFFIQRRKKSLAYEILSETALLTMKEGLQGKVQILFDNQPVQNVYLLVLKIINNGNVPITSSDFENVLTFFFGKDSKVLSAEIIDTNPKTLKPIHAINQGSLIIQPTLLNSGDAITFKLLLAKYSGEIEVDTRIVGVKEIKKVTEIRKQSMIISIFGFLLSIISLIPVMVIAFSTARSDPTTHADFQKLVPILPFLGLAILGYLMAIYGFLRFSMFQRAFKKYLVKPDIEPKD